MRERAPKDTIFDQRKQVEAPLKRNPNKGMSCKTQPPPSYKHASSEIKEVNRPPTSFGLEQELSKIKIILPLIELMKNKPFKKSIMKVLQPTYSIVSSDVISL
jgi:hypothetical protein